MQAFPVSRLSAAAAGGYHASLMLLMHAAGACFKDQGIEYTCVAGHLVAGNRDSAKRTLAKYACNSYREVSC